MSLPFQIRPGRLHFSIVLQAVQARSRTRAVVAGGNEETIQAGTSNHDDFDPLTTIPLPFGICDSWSRDFIFKNPNFNTSSITYAEFPELIPQGHTQYDAMMGTFSAHLSSQAAGGKIITWPGMADNLIMPSGTINYLRRAHKLDSNVSGVFFAPGVGHCGGGSGPIPNDVLMNLRA